MPPTVRSVEGGDTYGFSTYVTGFFTLLARYFSGCASRSISMRLWTEFAKGSNFRNLALFGSDYAGLGMGSRPVCTSVCALPVHSLPGMSLGKFSFHNPIHKLRCFVRPACI